MSQILEPKGAWKDVVCALRSWRQGGGPVVIGVLALGSAIAIATCMFSVVKAVLVAPLPFRQPERLAAIWEHKAGSKDRSRALPFNFDSWRRSSKVFVEMAATQKRQYLLAQGADSAQLHGEAISPSLFHLLGVQPALGRGFLPGEDVPGRNQLVILGSRLWRERFGSDPAVLGRSVTLDEQQYQVIGVAPSFPAWLGSDPDLWTPLVTSGPRVQHLRVLTVVGRLNPEATFAKAQQEFDRMGLDLERARPELDKNWKVAVVPLMDELLGNVRLPLMMLSVSVVLVLLIACANVASICLVRAVTRLKDMAIRSALGASKWHLMRLTLVESLVLTTAASALGVCAAYSLVGVILRYAPADIPRIREAALDVYAVGFAVGLALLTGIAVGIVPAYRASQIDVNESLKGSASAPPSASTPGGSRFFVAMQAAMAMALLAAATLLIGTLWRMQTRELGFNPHSVLTLKVRIPSSRYRAGDWVAKLYQRIIREMETAPGVLSVAATSSLPGIDPPATSNQRRVAGQPGAEMRDYALQLIDGDYFRTMGIAVRSGRTFDESELIQERPVVIVNETFARQFFDGQNAVGQRLSDGGTGPDSLEEVIGVVADVAEADFSSVRTPVLYQPLVMLPFREMNFVIRTSSKDALGASRNCTNRIQAIDPSLPVMEIRSMEDALSGKLLRPRFNTLLLGIFSLVAVLVALVGIYSVVAYEVSRSTREVGIRLALGAPRSRIVMTMLRRSLLPVIYGLSVGMVIAFASIRVISSMIAGSVAHPAGLLAAAFAVFVLIASIASLVPLLRTFDVNPVQTLRSE